MLSPQLLEDLRRNLERPYGFRMENPEVIRVLLNEIERLQREVERLRRSVD